MSIYTSQGTIRCEISNNTGGSETTNNNTDESETTKTIFFVPERDYSITHRTKHYAVFVPQSCNCNKAIVMKYNPDKGEEIKISADKFFSTDVLFGSAAHQTKVEILVNVEESEMSDLLRKKEEAEEKAAAAKKAKVAAAEAKKAKEMTEAEMDATAAAAVAKKAAADLKECLKLVHIKVPAK